MAIIFLLATTVYVMWHVDRSGDGFRFRGIERNDFTMLYNSQQKHISSVREGKSTKKTTAYSSFPINEENLKESQKDEEFEKLRHQGLEKDIPKPKSRPRRNLKVYPF